MGAFITQQPNGLYCRFSSIVDCPTHCNMKKEDYLNNVTGTVESRKEAEDVLENYLLPFSEVERRFTTLNMDRKDFNKLIKKMSEPIPVGESYHIVQSRRLFDERRDGMKVITTITITEEVQPVFEEQVRRNFERTPVLGGTDSGIKKHLKELLPTLNDENINIEFRLEENQSAEEPETFTGREAFIALGQGKVLYHEDDDEQQPIFIDDNDDLINAGYMNYHDLLGTWYSKPRE